MAAFKWWQTAVFYQIYPRSFADGNGDGIGDFKGIIAKLDYLQSLGIDAIWLSPHFPSPQWDCGYDISNYEDVEPEYGTLEEFKIFLEEAHKRGIRVVLDLVLNHTSDQHPWFLESRSSRDNPKRDWYIWQDPKPDGSPPNNWYATFGGSAWEYDEKTNSYYYRFFFKQQPDLNWRNPEVKKALFAAVRFWLDMGVDGYRLDAIGTIYEDPEMPDQQCSITLDELFKRSYLAKSQADWQEVAPLWEEMFKYQHDQPGIHELMRELREVVDEFDDRVLIGETDEISFYGSGDDELHLVFNFPLMRTERLTPAWVRENQKTRLGLLPVDSWPCNTLGNHDSPRVYNRFGDGKHNDALARQNLVLLLTLKGTPFLYNGEEIGMEDYIFTDYDRFRDQQAFLYYRVAKETAGLTEEEALRVACMASRDKNRTPNQWANTTNAGFSPEGVETWLPVNPNFANGVNVADQERDPRSMLNFYRRAVQVRRENTALIYGDYQPVDETSSDYVAYVRSYHDQRCLVLINMTAESCTAVLQLPVKTVKLLLSTHERAEDGLNLEALDLAPFEALVLEIN